MFYKAIYKTLQLLTRTRGLTKNGSWILMQNIMLPGHHFQWKILKKKKLKDRYMKAEWYGIHTSGLWYKAWGKNCKQILKFKKLIKKSNLEDPYNSLI